LIDAKDLTVKQISYTDFIPGLSYIQFFKILSYYNSKYTLHFENISLEK